MLCKWSINNTNVINVEAKLRRRMNRKMQDMTILITMETNNRSNANLIEENKIETDITIKYNNKITDETKILENEQLVQELEEQIL